MTRVSGQSFDSRCGGRIVLVEVNVEVEEAEFVGCVRRTDNKGTDMADIGVLVSNSDGEVRLALDFVDFLA